MKRLELFNSALKMALEKLDEYPDFFILKEIISQLEYLVSIEEGKEVDCYALMNMTLGRVTAQNIDNFDDYLADVLYEVCAEIPFMQKKYLGVARHV